MDRIARLIGIILLVGMLAVTSSCGGDHASGDGATSTSEERPAMPVSAPLSPEDLRLLSQEESPPLASVDYSKFPTGADPSLPLGHTYYVAPQGSDDGPGTQERPFHTIDHALLSAGDGDKVLVRGGTYLSDGLEVTQSNFLLANHEGEEVRVQAADGEVGLSLTSPGQRGVFVRGLSLEGFNDVGVYVGNPLTMRDVVLEDVKVSGSAEGLAGAYEEGLLVDGMLVNRLWLEDAQRIGFQFGVGEARNVRIVGLYVHMADSSNDDTWRDAIAFERGTNVLIENSIVEGAGGDGIDLKADRVAVVNSIVRHIGRNGVKLWNGGDLVNTLVFDTGADAQMVTEAGTYRIVNCTFAFHLKEGGRSYAATFAYDESASTDVTLTNNVFFAMPGELYFAPCASVHLDHNVFYGFPDAIVEWGSKEYGRSDLAAVFGESNLYVDPGFADPEAFDLHPGAGSFLLEAGRNGSDIPRVDITGASRGQTNTVGAFQ